MLLPVFDPLTSFGLYPESTIASNAVSNIILCLGSITSACRGLIPKYPASKYSTLFILPVLLGTL